MKYLTKNYLDKGDFTKAQEVIENLKLEIKSIIAKKEESKSFIKNYNNNLKNNNNYPEKQKIIGGDKLVEILEILKNVPRVAKLRVTDPLLIKAAYGVKLLRERGKKTREALKKAKRGEIFVYDDYIDPELGKIKKYVSEIEKNLEEQTAIIEEKDTKLHVKEILKNKELDNLIHLILKYYEKQFNNLFPKEKKEDVKELIDYIEGDLIELFNMDKIWQIFLLMHNLMLYEECVQIDDNFNFYLKTNLFKENKNFQDRRISSLVYKKEKEKKNIYYVIVGFHLFPLNDNFQYKKDNKENLENLNIIESNQFEEIDLYKVYKKPKDFIKYLEKQKELLEKNYFINPKKIILFEKNIKDKIENTNQDNLIREIKNFDFDVDTEKTKKLIVDIEKNIEELKKLKFESKENEFNDKLIEDLNKFIISTKTLLDSKNKQHIDKTKNEMNNNRNKFKTNFNDFKNKINKLQEQYKKALELLNEIDKIFMNNYSYTKIITPEVFQELKPVKFSDLDYETIKKITNEGEELKDYLKISYIEDKTKEQVDSYQKNNSIAHIKQLDCKDLFNINFEEQTKNIKVQNLRVDLEDLEIKKLTDIQKNIKKHTDDIIELYQNIDSLGKGPIKDIDDKDIKFSTNLLKQYVDKQILKGEKIKDIRRNFYRKIKRITQNDNDKYYLNKLEEIIAKSK